MKYIFIIVLFFLTTNLFAQENNWKNKMTGFIRSDIFYDSRKSAEAVDGMFLLYPLAASFDSAGTDINNTDQLTMTSLSSRIGVTSCGSNILGGRFNVTGKLEADFTARSNSNSLRFRHAYIKLENKNHQILMGRTWHPMFTPTVFPLTLSINIGAPFNPFNRSPQIQYAYKANNGFCMLTAILFQNDYASLVPTDGNNTTTSTQVVRNATFPNLHIQPSFKNEHVVLGAGLDYKKIKPRETTTGSAGVFKTNETIAGLSPYVFFKIVIDKLVLKSKFVYGQNLTDHLTTGGYGIYSYNQETGHEKYTPSNHINYWFNVEFGQSLKGGAFIGYNKNLGFNEDLLPDHPIMARGENIDNIYRGSTYIRYKTGRIEFWAETEYTTATYGEIVYSDHGKITNTNRYDNIRIQFSCVFLIL